MPKLIHRIAHDVSLWALVQTLRVVFAGLALIGRIARPNPRTVKLVIASGLSGWELIEYQELFKSATEYLGSSRVYKIAVSQPKYFFSEVAQSLVEKSATHFFFDPRGGPQESWGGIWLALRLGAFLSFKRIIPICILTDFPVRRWRRQVSIVSARKGSVAMLANPNVLGHLIAHRRFFGPVPMALSATTTKSLGMEAKRRTKSHPHPEVLFIGSLYEPRKSFIEAVQSGLKKKGIDLIIQGRVLGEKRGPDETYWSSIQQAEIVITTARQVGGPGIDVVSSTHMIYRTLEVPAAGSALAIERVESLDRYLVPGQDFIQFCSVEDAVNKIHYYLRVNPRRLSAIARSGNSRVRQLTAARTFWTIVDASLGSDSLL